MRGRGRNRKMSKLRNRNRDLKGSTRDLCLQVKCIRDIKRWSYENFRSERVIRVSWGRLLAWGHVDHQDEDHDSIDDHNETDDFDILEYSMATLIKLSTVIMNMTMTTILTIISTLVSLVCGDGHPGRHEGERGVLQDGRPRLQVGDP